MNPRRSFLWLSLAAALAASVSVAAPAPARTAAPAKGGDTTLPALREWLSRAAADSFYLVLDPKASKLELVLGGVVMRSFTVSNIQVAAPRGIDGKARLADSWHERVWTGATLDPPHFGDRFEIIAPEIGAEQPADVVVPPTPEEDIPVPPVFLVRFSEGLALEITGASGEQKGERAAPRLRTGFSEKLHMLWKGAPDAVRLRLRLSPENAAELYRSLPPGVDFVVAHPR